MDAYDEISPTLETYAERHPWQPVYAQVLWWLQLSRFNEYWRQAKRNIWGPVSVSDFTALVYTAIKFKNLKYAACSANVFWEWYATAKGCKPCSKLYSSNDANLIVDMVNARSAVAIGFGCPSSVAFCQTPLVVPLGIPFYLNLPSDDRFLVVRFIPPCSLTSAVG